jgi:gas vesicle protein
MKIMKVKKKIQKIKNSIIQLYNVWNYLKKDIRNMLINYLHKFKEKIKGTLILLQESNLHQLKKFRN